MLDEALDFVFWLFGSEVVAVADSDMAVLLGGSGGRTGGWEGIWSIVGPSGSKYHHFGSLACCSVARKSLVVVVVNDVVLLGLGGSGCEGRCL